MSTNLPAERQSTEAAKVDPRFTRVKALLELARPQIARLIPGSSADQQADRAIRIAITCCAGNDKLLDCSPASIVLSVMRGMEIGMPPSPTIGYTHLVPRGKVACLEVAAKGFAKLAGESAEKCSIRGVVVREGDKFSISEGTAPAIIHEPAMDPDRGSRPPTHVYAIATWGEGKSTFVWTTYAEALRKSRSKSQGYRYAEENGKHNSPWHTNEEEMLIKYMVKYISKYIPLGDLYQKAVAADNAAEIGQVSSDNTLDLGDVVLGPTDIDDDLPPTTAQGKGQQRLKRQAKPTTPEPPAETGDDFGADSVPDLNQGRGQ